MKIIKKKKLIISNHDLNIINDSKYQYIGIILCSKYSNKIYNINKILMNLTYIYLKNDNSFFIQKISDLYIIDDQYLFEILKNTFNVQTKIVDFHKKIFISNKITIYMVSINNMKDVNLLNSYSWRKFFDFYQYYFIKEQDLYESIYFRTNLPNSHLKKILTNEFNINIQLESIYSAMIGEYIIKYNKIDKIKQLKDIK